MIQVSFAWQTWWRLPILMVGSGSKEKNTGLLHTGIFDQNFFLSTIHPAPRMAGALCFEWGFMRTFPGNQDVTVKYKSEVIYVKFS